MSREHSKLDDADLELTEEQVRTYQIERILENWPYKGFPEGRLLWSAEELNKLSTYRLEEMARHAWSEAHGEPN